MRSTKKAEQNEDKEDADEDLLTFPTKNQDIYIKIYDIRETLYMD